MSSINPSVLLLLAVIAPAAAGLWLFRHLRRTVAVLFAATAFLLVVGYSTWRDSLASLVTTERALAGLLFVAVISGLILAIMVHSARKPRGAGKPHQDYHHHVWTPAVALVAGTSLALAIGDGINLLRQLSHAPAGTSAALAQAMTQINSGHAGQAVPHSQGLTVVAIGVGVLAVLIFLARWHSGEGKRHRGGKPGGKTAALPPGASHGGPPARIGGR